MIKHTEGDDDLVRQIVRLVHGRGTPCEYGCSEEEIPEMISLCKQMFPGKPYRVVEGWCWADFELDEEQMEIFKNHGLKSSFIYADKIVEDGSDRGNKGLSVKTTPLVEFHHGCLFVTRNTCYVLVGIGTRMTVHPKVYSSIFF